MRLAPVLLCSALAWGCSQASESSPRLAEESYRGAAYDAPSRAMAPTAVSEMDVSSEAYEDAPMAAPAPAAMPASKVMSTAGGSPTPQRAPEQRPEQRAEPQKPKAQRMVHYNGFVRLKVTTPDETLAQAAKLAQDLGGYVEAQAATTITLRVPVARVREAFSALLKLGDVLARSLTAQDVTDAYTAAELRLKTMRASRDRLVELLARAKNEHEKLSLLREIQRLTEQIDQLELQVKTLAALASYSRLTLEAVPRQAHVAQNPEELAAFRWIQELSPFRRDVAQRGDTLELAPPDGMVVLGEREHWIAESADGAVIWSSKHENEPRGATEFWVKALEKRLGAEYGNAEVVKVGRYEFVRVIDSGETAYRYMVGVLADGDDLNLVEVYYPTPKHEQRHEKAVRSALERGES